MRAAPPKRPARVLPGLELLGDIARFSWLAMRRIPRARAYAGEVMRQMALLVTGTTLVILAGCVMVGQSCGLESAYVARATGTPTLAPSAAFGCAVLYVVPFLFGFILAAKVGCGFVAEIGAMQVDDEVDALEVMGVDSIVYLVSTRLLASALVMPMIYTLAIGAADLGAYLQAGVRFQDVSQGTYETYRYAFYGPSDVLLSLGQGLVIATVVISVGLFYGYRVHGGPVEVGLATAKSMVVNLIAVTSVNLVFIILFLLKPRLPIA